MTVGNNDHRRHKDKKNFADINQLKKYLMSFGLVVRLLCIFEGTQWT
jgi:hypothetical protein